jgi:hypothetical protein
VYSERRKGGDTMITRRHLLLAIATTCLVTMFLITTVPIFSQTAGQYNPLYDVNHDGKIDIKDIAYLAKAFGTAGDPTVPVNVTNWPPTYKVAVISYVLMPTTITINSPSNWIFCEGYSKMSIMFQVTNATSNATSDVNLELFQLLWSYDTSSQIEQGENVNGFNITIHVSPTGWSYSQATQMFQIETKAPLSWPVFSWSGSAPANYSIAFSLWIYLRNE